MTLPRTNKIKMKKIPLVTVKGNKLRNKKIAVLHSEH